MDPCRISYSIERCIVTARDSSLGPAYGLRKTSDQPGRFSLAEESTWEEPFPPTGIYIADNAIAAGDTVQAGADVWVGFNAQKVMNALTTIYETDDYPENLVASAVDRLLEASSGENSPFKAIADGYPYFSLNTGRNIEVGSDLSCIGGDQLRRHDPRERVRLKALMLKSFLQVPYLPRLSQRREV